MQNKILAGLLVLFLASCENITVVENLQLGQWGDAEGNSMMQVMETSISFQFGCAAAVIPNNVNVNNNAFEVKGTYTQLSGAVPKDFVLKPKPSVFKGKLIDKTLAVDIFVDGSTTPISHKYELGKEVRLMICP